MQNPSNEPRPETPPYVAYTTFKNTVRSLEHEGRMAGRLDPSALSSMSGSAKKQFLASLKALALIDTEGVPSDQLKNLAAADSDTQWSPLIKDVVSEYYKPQLPALESGTPQQLKEAFGDIPASTVAPAMRFFIHAAKDAGFPISHVIEKSKGASSAGRTKRRARKPEDPTTKNGTAKPEQTSPQSIHAALLAKFPEFDPEWDESRQTAWFSAYEKLLEMNK